MQKRFKSKQTFPENLKSKKRDYHFQTEVVLYILATEIHVDKYFRGFFIGDNQENNRLPREPVKPSFRVPVVATSDGTAKPNLLFLFAHLGWVHAPSHFGL